MRRSVGYQDPLFFLPVRQLQEQGFSLRVVRPTVGVLGEIRIGPPSGSVKIKPLEGLDAMNYEVVRDTGGEA
jgi:hypothetical protein